MIQLSTGRNFHLSLHPLHSDDLIGQVYGRTIADSLESDRASALSEVLNLLSNATDLPGGLVLLPNGSMAVQKQQLFDATYAMVMQSLTDGDCTVQIYQKSLAVLECFLS